jgi:class 3 adenylate cyclase
MMHIPCGDELSSDEVLGSFSCLSQTEKLFVSRYALALRCLRILPHKSVELNRQIAATRIQRAWRNRNTTFWEVRSGKSEGSQAWRSPRDGMSLDDLNPSSRLDHSNRRSPKARVMVDQNGGGQSGPLVQGRGEGEAPSRVGAVMAELTGHRVVVFLLLNLLIVLTFTYIEPDNTDASTMIILHHQTTRGNPLSAMKAVEISRRTVLPNLFLYTVNSSSLDVNLTFPYEDLQGLREYEIRNITITDAHGQSTGLFSARDTVGYWAMMELYLLVFVLLLWFFGVAAFAAPIMSLVIVPIERAVKLMSMLVADPLGYRSTLQYKNFLTEADQIATDNGRWTRDVLKGMETEFLMSTIDRIGSLMKVGFGSAGVRIIRNSLQKNDDKDTGAMLLNSKGSIVSCIFLFCDIRSFTDATECLQEEVFAFTNRVAAVVHSICSSYGGSANKNIGDAFLISWKLDGGSAPATRHQADKALLSVVKICIALHHNDFYLAMLSDKAKERLLDKMKNRPGPTVQIGFGLHAGKAVEGAIGSQRKIDATYVSMAVETAEYLESSTKKYKVPILMSGSFHRLLQPSRRTRCRLLDRVVFEDGNAEVREGGTSNRDKPMKLFTYDMDVDALWNDTESDDDSDDSDTDSADLIAISSPLEARRNESRIWSRRKGDAVVSSSVRSRASGIADSIRSRGTEITAAIAAAAAKAMRTGPEPSRENNIKKHGKNSTPELVLPTGPALYSENVWLQSDIRRIRRRYTTNIFDTFNLALQKYYAKEWDEARKHFEAILENFDDGPSKFYLGEIRKHDGIPPPDFRSFEKF